MGSKSFEIEVKPEVFKWLRESAGWTEEELGKRLKTSAENVQRMERGDKKPTINQLKELSKVFKRPVAAFLLPEPRQEKPKPKDYRMLSDRTDKFDKKTLFVLRNARSLQEVARQLSLNIEYETETHLGKASLSDNPEEIAKVYRGKFGLTKEKQRTFKSTYELLNFLRDYFERQNIYVFQFAMPVEDARGFVLIDEYPYVVVVNTKDSPEARLFSIMHEFAHVLLGESAIDLPDVISISRDRTETWCNLFAASFLLPKDIAKADFTSFRDRLTDRGVLKKFSNLYKVSKAVLLRTMFDVGYITKQEYERKLTLYKPELEPPKIKSSKKGGAAPSDVRKFSEIGNKFVFLVAENYDKKKITYADALDFLSTKSKNFEKILSKAKK